MVCSRVYGILAGLADPNDHGTIRADPVFKLVAGRSPEDYDLASQPTLSRFENAIAILGADNDLAYLVTRLRRAWPAVALHFRGDCGFGVPGMYEVCERLRISYTFGLSANAVLQRDTEGLLAEAVAAYERERQVARQQDPPRQPVPSRLFTGFWYQAGTWPQPRWFMANYFRLYLHAAALKLLVRLRRFIAEPLPALASCTLGSGRDGANPGSVFLGKILATVTLRC
jgi:hypothetical protein